MNTERELGLVKVFSSVSIPVFEPLIFSSSD